MNPKPTLLTIALTATLAVAAPSFAHIFTSWLPLTPVGYLDPFGHDTLKRYTDVASDGTHVWLSTRDQGVALLGLSPAGKPQAQAIYAPSPLPSFTSVALGADAAYLSTDGDGIHIVGSDLPSAPIRKAHINGTNGGFDHAGRVAVHKNRLFATSPQSSRIAVLDVSNSAHPVGRGYLETKEAGQIRDIFVAGQHLYIAGTRGRDGDGAIYIYNLEDLEKAPRILSTGPETTSGGVTDDERFLVVSHEKRGGDITIHDLLTDTPSTPIARIGAADYEINSYSPSLVRVKDQVAYVAWHQGGVQLIDLDTLDVTGLPQRIGVFGTASGISPLEGFAGNVSAFPFVGPTRVLLTDTKWGLYVVDATQVLPPESGELE